MTTDRSSGQVSSHVSRGLQRRKPAPLALEARIMFDGAAVATAAEAVKPAVAEAPVAQVAEQGSVVAASQAESRSTAPATDTGKVAEAAKPAEARATDGLASSGTKVLFVDSRVPDYQQIVAAADADVKVVILDAERDGLQQIAEALRGMHDVASISIVSHGDSGVLLLGDTALRAGDLAHYQAELGTIGAALHADGEILLYGCDVGEGSVGQNFIQSLADATGAVVAASTDGTGDFAHGGNWDLEATTGTLSSAPVLNVSLLADYEHSLAVATPAISNVEIPNATMKVGDVVTVRITVANDGGEVFTLYNGTVAGYTLSNLTRVNATTYNARFTVPDGGTDSSGPDDDLAVYLILSNSLNNRNTAYTEAIVQFGDSINANAPKALALSNASVQGSQGANATVGTLSATDASPHETLTYSLVSGTGSTDNTSFTINGSVLSVNNPAALGNGARSILVRTTDSAGNFTEQVFSINVSNYVAPVAIADTASATEAGGVTNATAGVNPSGNVLNNDSSSNGKTVTAITGGTVGAALVGTYGSLTLNADGTYVYTVSNNNAAVQALRTNADTLTDTFNYTMSDGSAAVASTSLTVTIHGANDAPSVSTALTTQQATVNTALVYVVPVGTFADVDAGDTLTYTATLSGGAPLPVWLSFNGATRTFSGTPSVAENLSLVVTATDLSLASASSMFTLAVASAPVVVPPVVVPPVVVPPVVVPPVVTPPVVTPTDPVVIPPVTTPVVPPVVSPVTPTAPVTPVTPTPVAPVAPVVPVVTPSVQIPDPQVPNTPQSQPALTAAVTPPLQTFIESLGSTVALPDWSANRMISSTSDSGSNGAGSSSLLTASRIGSTGSSTAFFPSTGASSGSSPVNERYSALSPTPFNDFQRTQTDSGPGIFSVAISPLGQTGLTVLRGVEDQQVAANGNWSFSVPANAFSHSDSQPGVVLKATQVDGRALPAWLSFDGTTGQFDGNPPPGFKDEFVIKVTARDSRGNQVEVTFRVKPQGEPTRADGSQGRSGLSEQLRTAANRAARFAAFEHRGRT